MQHDHLTRHALVRLHLLQSPMCWIWRFAVMVKGSYFRLGHPLGGFRVQADECAAFAEHGRDVVVVDAKGGKEQLVLVLRVGPLRVRPDLAD